MSSAEVRRVLIQQIQLAPRANRRRPSATQVTADTIQGDPRGAARDIGIRAALRTDGYSFSGAPARGPVQVVDLFCGCGGLSAGFEIVGRLADSYRLVGAADIDPVCVTTYAANLPVSPLVTDLARAASGKRGLRPLMQSLRVGGPGPLVVIGGPPCQGFSAHRKKAGDAADPRNDLLLAFAEIACHLNPDFIVLENVPEMLARKHWGQYKMLRDRLMRAGYVVRAQIHNLAGFGVPQERFRALVLAAKTPFHMPRPFLMSAAYRTVRDAIGWLPAVEPGMADADDPMHVCTAHRRSTIETLRQVPKDGGRRPAGVGPSCLDRVDGFRDVYGRLYWNRPANTITAYARNPASGRYAHPEQDRGLTIREASQLQGFPRSFVFEGPFDHRFLQIGNAVPPTFASYLAAHVLGELLAEPTLTDGSSTEADVLVPTSNSFSSGIAGRKKGARR